MRAGCLHPGAAEQMARQIESWKSSGHCSGVKILPGLGCEVAESQSGVVYPLDAAPDLPLLGCSRQPCCGCCYVPVLAESVQAEATFSPEKGKNKMPLWKKILVGVGVFWLIGAIGGMVASGGGSAPKTKDALPATVAAAKSAGVAEAKTPVVLWDTIVREDKVSGKQEIQLTIKSTNRFDLSFPYQGGTFGEITVRKHPRYGKGVVFSINKGQLLCGITDGCSLTVRFDNNKPIKFHADEPADHSNTYLFIAPYDKFVKLLKQSSIVVIEATFYQQGSLPFEFSTAGFPSEKLSDGSIKK